MKAEYLYRLSFKILSLFCFLFLFSYNCYAARNASETDRIYLLKIENFLNNIKNLSSDFVQNHNGTVSRGKFYISRVNITTNLGKPTLKIYNEV